MEANEVPDEVRGAGRQAATAYWFGDGKTERSLQEHIATLVDSVIAAVYPAIAAQVRRDTLDESERIWREESGGDFLFAMRQRGAS
jgi:hypothetical protein